MVRILIALALVGLLVPPAAFASDNCGYRFDDWCTAAGDGACGRHADAAACRADAACRGMEYRGESVVACQWDENGYADNCPTVGCLDRK